MMDLSIIIPSYNEPYLDKTVADIHRKSESDVEIIVRKDEGQGMRAGINYGLTHAKGKYIMKCDAHCAFDQGFDRKLLADMQDNWLVIPRRYALHADNWDKDERFSPKDYHFLAYPDLSIQVWRERTQERQEYDIDDTMSFQGSCYLANKDYFMKHVGLLDDRPETYGTFALEQLEVGLKYWLGGGEVKVNKKTWYAHLFKNQKYYDKFPEGRRHKKRLKVTPSWKWATNHWMNDEEPGMKYSFSWLVDKFRPIPTWTN
jgi:glycosyltransferase involved in cell wall biosynthesis